MNLRLRKAQTYWQRLRGLLWTSSLAHDEALHIRPCNSVHTFGMRYAIDVVFVDKHDRVLKIVPHLPAWRVAACWRAAQVYEFASGGAARYGLAPGQQFKPASGDAMARAVRLQAQRGASTAEMVVLMPTALFALMLVLQTALMYHAKGQSNVAAMQAARAGSMDHARVSAIKTGFGRGMVAYMGGGLTAQDLLRSTANAGALALVADVEILSPNAQAFTDYASELQADRLRAEGMEIDAPVIQNLNIAGLQCPWVAPGQTSSCNPNTATNASGQSLQDANLLKVRIVWGIPASKQVPLAGPFMVQTLRALNEAGLFSQSEAALRQLALGAIPMSVTSTVRMQSEPILNDNMAQYTRPATPISQRASGVFALIAAASAPAGAGTAPTPAPPPEEVPPGAQQGANQPPTELPTAPAENPNQPANPFPNGVPTPAPAPPAPVPEPSPPPIPPTPPAPPPPPPPAAPCPPANFTTPGGQPNSCSVCPPPLVT